MNKPVIEALLKLKKSRSRDDLRALTSKIDTVEYQQLDNGLYRHGCGDGPEYLDQTCNRLIDKYRSDIPPRQFKKTIL
jgi:hypothetical protein